MRKPMYELKTIIQFGAAHQLRNYKGKCENLHGHNWKIEVYVKGENLDENGLLVDFKVIKDKTKEIVEELDHKFLNELEYFRDINPSSENIARYIYESLERGLNDNRIKVSRVTAWESDNACATYVGK
jgi:6-pyruvoyltetrahydropterin/6-carboxytetrahydropterin synthase